MPYLVSAALGYLIGSFPTAYLFIKWKAHIDIRRAGSGNVGAMNAYDITGSRTVGICIMVIDMLKGIIAVAVCALIWGDNVQLMSTGGIFAVVGHNYPVWLSWKGGRGLATSAGIMVVLGWMLVAVWGSLWVMTYSASRNIHKSNILASVISPFVLLLFPEPWLNSILPSFTRVNIFIITSFVISIMILLRHVDVIREFLNGYKQQSL